MPKIIFYTLLLCLNLAMLHAKVPESISEGEAREPNVKIDTLTVEGAVLQGRVTGLTSDALSFSLIYGTGSIQIPYANIQQLSTEHWYHIFYNGKESVGRISSIYDSHWLVVDDGAEQHLVKIEDIERFILSVRDDDSFVNRIHNYFPFWSGNFDLGLEYEEGGTNKRKVNIATRFEYNRLEQRIVIIGTSAYELQQTTDSNWTTTKDEYLFNIEDDIFLTRGQEEFLFLSAGIERDAVRQIQRRMYPAGGAGYKHTVSKRFWFNLQLGLGGVFDQYIDYGRDNYAAVYMGSELKYSFANGAVIRGKAFYMPSIFHSRSAWLFRTSGSLSIPVTTMFDVKLSISDIDDNNPDPSIGNNKITTNFAFSFTF